MRFWNFIKNAATQLTEESIELRIEGDIVCNDEAWIYEWFDMEHSSPNAFKTELSQYNGKDITVWIDSYGGDVLAAASIYNALKEHNGNITVKIDSKAMSAASVIAMAGDQILMSPVAIMMIHNPLTSVTGDMRTMRKTADILDTVKETILNAYSLKTGKSIEEISSMMDDESYMSANVAVKNGFADGILYADEQLEIKNIKDFSYNRTVISNCTSDSIKKMFNLEKEKFINQQEETGKEKLLIELDLL